ncbi:hypothetical protein C4K04_2038 [Pseudomonas chlororaphis]|jgi:hypothetical protein|uniref:DUF4325 domain-containing protein n=1 Tax=Pseudomonas chlororaphis TaxID=587753 RepID=A0A3G7TMW4_9PSED|nr:STAS-like domain-containing protein [Pseudomonas chlororaphis]AZE47722.1 hypothetical protein C4K04_2038 [Pseudomonas chlororaphis]
MEKIKVFELTGRNAISMQNGEKLYNALHSKLMDGQKIEINFEKVNLFASPFFNASIGLLLKDIEVGNLQKQLSVTDLSDVGRDLLNHVISNAITFYKNSENVSKAIDQTEANNNDE